MLRRLQMLWHWQECLSESTKKADDDTVPRITSLSFSHLMLAALILPPFFLLGRLAIASHCSFHYRDLEMSG
jgi:hypothetical protein